MDNFLSAGWTFGGSFAFSKTYDAPNPALTLENVGIVGLPLSKQTAAAIGAASRQAPFGMGERTVIDTSVRDTCEMDASMVSFPRFCSLFPCNCLVTFRAVRSRLKMVIGTSL